jgi:hypothetical protein
MNKEKSMKKTVIFVFFIFVVLGIVCFQYSAHSTDKSKFSKHFNESLFNITDQGYFSVEILLDNKEYAKLGKGVIGIVIHNQYDKDVAGVDVELTSVMPDGQVNTETPTIKDKGNGLYTVSNINLNKEEQWELKINLKKKKLKDSTSFLFPNVLNKRLPAGKYSADQLH